VPQSTVLVPQGVSPSQALTTRSAPLVFSTDFLGGLLESLLIENNGRLTRNTPQTLPDAAFADFPSSPRLPLGLAVHPLLPILYVGFTPINRIGVYEYNAKGDLTFLNAANDSGAAVCWLTVNRAGTRMYASNTADNSISVFDLANPRAPQEIQHLLLRGQGSSFQLALNSEETFLHVVDQRASEETPTGQGDLLHVLRVDPTGILTEVATSPTDLHLPENTRPQGVVAF
jgi:hypothetical protein